MQYKMLINGQLVATQPHGGNEWQVINPATEAPVADVPYGGAAEDADRGDCGGA